MQGLSARRVARTQLYLDTARLGLPSRRTASAISDLALLSSEEGLSLRFEELLKSGYSSWSAPLQRRYQALRDWEGIGELKRSFRNTLGADDEVPVYLASRSADLMRLAAKLLFRRCKRVLITDLSWPGYREILREESGYARAEVVEISTWRSIVLDQMAADELVQEVRARYRATRCDGLFLPAVTHDGLRLPVREIVESLSLFDPPEFVVADGAQSFCHTPLLSDVGACDLVLFGCHKWLSAHHPLGVALAPRLRSRFFVESSVLRMTDDPLLRFATELETGGTDQFSETVNVSALFSAQAAIADAQSKDEIPRTFEEKLNEASTLAEVAEKLRWRALLPQQPFRSGIVLLRPPVSRSGCWMPNRIRRHFQDRGVSITAYDHNTIRVSVPDRQLVSDELSTFSSALRYA